MTQLKYQPQQRESHTRKRPMPKKGDRRGAVEIVQFLGYKPHKTGTFPIFEILCHECNQTREIAEGNFRRIKSCGCMQYANCKQALKKAHNKKRNSESIHKKQLNQPLKNGWTLIAFNDLERNKKSKRIMNYTLQCENGHTLTHKSISLSPNKKAEQKPCWCTESNPFIRERKRHGLTQKDVGKHFNVSQTRAQHWEDPMRTISKERLQQLIDLYGTSDDVKKEMVLFKSNAKNNKGGQ